MTQVRYGCNELNEMVFIENLVFTEAAAFSSQSIRLQEIYLPLRNL
jgi:hypothetical protein